MNNIKANVLISLGVVVVTVGTIIISNVSINKNFDALNHRIIDLENLIKTNDESILNGINEVSEKSATKEDVSLMKQELLGKLNILSGLLNNKVDKDVFDKFAKQSLENDAKLGMLETLIKEIKAGNEEDLARLEEKIDGLIETETLPDDNIDEEIDNDNIPE